MQTSRFSALSAFAVLFLAACSMSSHTVTYDLSFNVTDASQIDPLTNAAMRVVERRLDNMGVVNPGKEFGKEARPSLIITVPDKEGADELTRQLTAPFSMSVMKQTASGGVADITVEGHGGFTKTDITTEDFLGVEAGKDSNGKVRARILMTDEGRKKMDALFKSEVNKNIGIFVRDRLVSKLMVKSDALTDDLQIQNIPNLLVAEAFTDDVNVGLHVVYTPKP